MNGFDTRFATRSQAERYGTRYQTGRRLRTHERECAALRDLLDGISEIPAALDLPGGTGRLTPVLAEYSTRIIVADSSSAMLEIAREALANLSVEYLRTDAENLAMPGASVDLVFCHRLLPHIYNASLRKRILGELRRVTRRYVVLSYYPPGFRSRFRWAIRSLFGSAERCDQLATVRQFLEEISACKLRLVRRKVLRMFPASAFFLVERA